MSKHRKKDVGALVLKKGVSFRVWAPFANAVFVTGTFNDWQQTALVSEGDGYWSEVVNNAEPGQEYKYVIVNGDKIFYKNDPRSFQVTTYDGNSVIVDQTYDWEGTTYTAQPHNKHVIYELHIGTFFRKDPSSTGTFDQAAEKLDYLAELGVTTIEMMPVFSMYMDRGWGYAPDYPYSVETLYGGRRQMLDFIKAAHKRGIAVVLDVVYNHFGPETSSGMWQFDGWSENNMGGIYYFNDWRAYTPWGSSRPDYGRPEVRQYIVDNVTMWLQDFKVDGLRLDSTIFMRNSEGRNDDPEHDIPSAWLLMQEINTVARKINPSALMIAEDVSANSYITKSVESGGAHFSSQWKISFAYTLHNVLRAVQDSHRDIHTLGQVLTETFDGDAFQSIIYSDSHDSAANGGARLNSEIAPRDPDSIHARRRAILAAGFLMTAPGIPMLFQGQEFMQPGSFTDWDSLDWRLADLNKGIVLAHRHLIALRKNIYGTTSGLCGHNTAILSIEDEHKILVYHRWDKGGPCDDVIIVANLSNSLLHDYEVHFPRDGRWIERFTSSWEGYAADFTTIVNTSVDVADGRAAIHIGPYSFIIFSQDDVSS